MLRITESESANAAKHYFGRSLSRGDYYFEEQEMVGEWGGKAARQLNLVGTVEHDAFLKLLDNERSDGTRLTARTVENRRPGYDFTFDVPKSVSLLHAIGRDERIPEAMRKAVEETMREIEEEMHARVRKNGAFEDRRTGNMVWADFTHFTSRPAPLTLDVELRLIAANPWIEKFRGKEGRLAIPDPHLHSHVYVMNATFDPVEKQWKAGEFMRLKRDASYYQAAYHVRLAGELQKLGYEINPVGKAFEITGVPRSVVELFSRRTKEVEDAAAALGITAADAKAQLGAKTRRGKDTNLTLGQLNTLWRSVVTRCEARELEEISALAKVSGRGLVPNDPEAARAGVRYALGRELERVSETSKKRILATALEHAVGRVRVPSVHDALSHAPGVLQAEVSGEQRLTTVEILAEEGELMRIVRGGRGRVPPVVEGEYRFKNPLFKKQTKETDEQRAAIKHVLQSQDWVVGVVGRAGTGKTTLLKEVNEGVKDAGRELVLCAPTAEAARGVLRGEGFAQANTVKRLLTDPQMQSRLRGNVLWIDEAGMLGNRDTLALLKLARNQGAARVVLAGDPSQIRSVPRGDSFRFMEENAGLRVARLEMIKRQRTPALKAAVEAMSRGDVDHGMGLLDSLGAIVGGDQSASYRSLARSYVEKISQNRRSTPESVLVVCPTHREGEAVTEVIRDELRSAGRIGREERGIPRTVNLSWTEAEKRNPAAYEEGLIVQFKQNLNGFRKSERVRVTAIDARNGKVMVLKNDRSETSLPLDRTDKFQVYRLTELKVAKGDRLRITENGFDKGGSYRLNNGAFVTVDGFTPTGDIKMANSRVLPRQFGHLNHGYVVTADAAQAKTVDTVFAAIGRDSLAATDLRRVYVTVSRAREEVRIFTDDREGLLLAAKRDNERRSATELVGNERSRAVLRQIHQREARRQIETARVHTPAVETQRPRIDRRRDMELNHG